jgi:hypothetical protein
MADSTTITKRTRMEFADHVTLKEVEAHRHQAGGWIVKHDDGRIFWFCHNHTRSEIINEIPGYFDIY